MCTCPGVAPLATESTASRRPSSSSRATARTPEPLTALAPPTAAPTACRRPLGAHRTFRLLVAIVTSSRSLPPRQPPNAEAARSAPTNVNLSRRLIDRDCAVLIATSCGLRSSRRRPLPRAEPACGQRRTFTATSSREVRNRSPALESLRHPTAGSAGMRDACKVGLRGLASGRARECMDGAPLARGGVVLGAVRLEVGFGRIRSVLVAVGVL